MSSNNMIQHISRNDVMFIDYPIKIRDISLYIPAAKSGAEVAALEAANIGAQVVKPVTITLMVVALPVATALIKILQTLDFLDLLNIKNMPMNVRFILALVGQGNFIGDMIGSIIDDFWNFEDPSMESSDSSQREHSKNTNLLGRLRLLGEESELDSDICMTHFILYEKDMSCYG